MTGANNFSVSGYGPERAGWTRLFARDSLARRLDWPPSERMLVLI